MKDRFSFDEVIGFAMKIEENGEFAYRRFAEIFKKKENNELYEFFTKLADQEIEHKNIFEKMAVNKSSMDMENQNPEYYDYLKSYVYDIIFPKDKLDKIIKNIDNFNKALQFAIRAELDSIMFYMDMKGLFGKKMGKDIDKIIEEERRHYLSLKDKLI